MRDLIKRLLNEFSSNDIQQIYFDGFSDPVLIPQFKMYLVKFNGTGRDQKQGDSEKILFIDNKTKKEYIFNSDDVQKSGNSPFYISLDVLRKYYDVQFDDESERYVANLTKKEYDKMFNDFSPIYKSEGRCKNDKCRDLRNAIESSLKEMYGDNYGPYVSYQCDPTSGFLNDYPLNKSYDDNGNQWSKLNYVIFREEAASTLVMAYIKKFGTFEHREFIRWINDEKESLFRGQFLELMFRNINLPKSDRIAGSELIGYIQGMLPNAKLVDSFCPSTRASYTETITVSDDGKKKTFQPIIPKSKRIFRHNGKLYLFFGRMGGAPPINRRADYIITHNGTIFENSNILTGTRAWELTYPPVYYQTPPEYLDAEPHKIK